MDWRDLRGSQHFNYGYALTAHKSQGSQWPHVIVYDESGTFREDWKRWLYTAITRARQCVYVWGGETTVRATLGEQAVRCTLLEASLAALTPAPSPAP